MSSSLTGAVKASVLSVLEECNDALAVYQCTLKNQLHRRRERPEIHKRLDIDLHIPAVTTEVSLMRSYDTKDNLAALEMANEEVIFEKLRKDSQWLDQLMYSAKQSLVTKSHLDVLINEISEMMAKLNAEEELLAKARETEDELKEMQREINETQEKRKEKEDQLKAELLKLRNEKEKLEIKSQLESAYVKTWLTSRHEQENLRAKISREQLTKELQRCQLCEENERLVTNKIEVFLHESIEKNKKGTLEWIERRRIETRLYERDIRELQDEIEKKRMALDELQRDYEERQDFIDNCLAEKEVERRRREYEEHVNCCAIKIQAWWRGVMVRRKLGPYRPEEKKKKRPAKPKK